MEVSGFLTILVSLVITYSLDIILIFSPPFFLNKKFIKYFVDPNVCSDSK